MDSSQDTRPNTVVLHQFTGIGDLIWHIQYFKAVAAQSRGGKVTVIAQPSTFARQILSHEPWVDAVIDHDHRPRRGEGRRSAHGGPLGIYRFAQSLKPHRFDRIVLFSGRLSRGLLAWWSGIPIRMGYGYNLLQRLCLNAPPYIPRYEGPAVAVLKETSAFAVAQGFCARPLVPRMAVPDAELAQVGTRLEGLPRPLVALAIGTSEARKQWGGQQFRTLGERLAASGAGVVVLGGPGEAELAREIVDGIDPALRSRVRAITDLSILGSAAALKHADACVGNDTGMVNISAAVERPTFVLLGNRPVLDHDPLLHCLKAPSLAELSVEVVLAALKPVMARS